MIDMDLNGTKDAPHHPKGFFNIQIAADPTRGALSVRLDSYLTGVCYPPFASVPLFLTSPSTTFTLQGLS